MDRKHLPLIAVKLTLNFMVFGFIMSFLKAIIAISDVYDAITYERPYRKGVTVEEARSLMLENGGMMFEPRLVDMVLDIPALDIHS